MSENSEDCEYEAIFFDVLDFLEEYEKLPCLWDRSHEQFKDRKERLKCEEILGEKLGIHDLRTLRRKIRSVRGTYNTEIRKIKYCIENGSEVFEPRLFWFPRADKFLRVTTDLPYEVFPLITAKNNIRKRKLLEKLPRKKGIKLMMLSTARKQQKLSEQTSISIEEEIKQENNDRETIESYEEYEELESLGQEEIKSQDGDMSVKFDTLDEFCQNEFNDSDSMVSKIKPATVKSQELSEVVNYIKDMATDNEFVAFGRSVGIQLQNMPLDIAVQLQMDIQAHISQTRLEYLKQSRKQMESE